MSRMPGKRGRAVPAEVFYFPKQSRGIPLRSERTGAGQTITDWRNLEDPEFPTEFFYVPDFFAQFDEKRISVPPRPKTSSARHVEPKGRKRTSGSRRRLLKDAVNKASTTAQAASSVGGRKPAAPASRTPVELALQGHRYFEKGRMDEARRIFERLVREGSTDAFPYTMLGTICHALGNADRALVLFDKALTLDRKDVAARVYRGEIQLGRGELRRALEDLTYALKRGKSQDPFVDRAAKLLKRVRRDAAAAAR